MFGWTSPHLALAFAAPTAPPPVPVGDAPPSLAPVVLTRDEAEKALALALAVKAGAALEGTVRKSRAGRLRFLRVSEE